MKRRFSDDQAARLWIAVGKVCPITERERWVGPLIEALPRCGRPVLEAGWCALVAAGEADLAGGIEDRIGAERVRELARAKAVDVDASVRLAVVAWAGGGGAWMDSADLVVRGLSDPERAVAEGAEDVIEGIVESVLSSGGDERAARALLALAASEFELHQSVRAAAGVLAMRRSGAAGDAAWERLAGDEPGRVALARAMRSGVHGCIRVRAWELAGVPWLASAAIDRLRKPCGAEEHARVLERGHLGRSLPRRAAFGARAERDQAAIWAALAPMNAATLSRIGESACIGLGRVLASLGAAAQVRERWGRAVLGHSSPLVRWAAWRATPRRTAIDYAFDREVSIARSAALAAADGPGPWGALAKSEHGEVRAIAIGELARRGEVWLDRSDAILGLKRRVAREPAMVERSWRERWEAACERDRATLVRLAFRVGLGERVTETARSVIAPDAEPGSGGAKLTATAVACLGASPEARACLRAADARVRANAAEAMAIGEAENAGTALLLDMKADPHHRVRASVVRRLALAGMMRGSEILGELEAMLEHEAAAHRLAGAWLASRVGGLVERGRAIAVITRGMEREREGVVRVRLADAGRRMGCSAGFAAREEAA